MVNISINEIVNRDLMIGAFIHDAHIGFKEDYSVLNCLLKIYNPSTIFEVGSNIGNGINVMATALPNAKILSLDLDYETMRGNSNQYPIGPNGEDRVGSAAKFPYTQLRGDSRTFDFSEYPCEAYFIDGEHTEEAVTIETKQAVKCQAKLIVWHDSDVPEVMSGIVAGLGKGYDFYRVTDTRIAYALLKHKTKKLK